MQPKHQKWRICDTKTGGIVWEGDTEQQALDEFFLLRMNGYDEGVLQILQPWH